MRTTRANVVGSQEPATTVSRRRYRKLACLRLGALPRRIEYHRIETFEFGLPQRAAREVAQLDGDRLEAGCSRRSASQGCACVLVVVDRGDFGTLGKA